jgi:hypothetical protein
MVPTYLLTPLLMFALLALHPITDKYVDASEKDLRYSRRYGVHLKLVFFFNH